MAVAAHRTGPTPDYSAYHFDVTLGYDHAGFTFRWGGCEVLSHEIPIPTPSFEYGMIKVCLAGSGVLAAGDEEWEVSAGMAFWSAPNNATLLTAAPDEGMINLGIALAGAKAADEMQRFLHAPVGAVRLAVPEAVDSVFRQIMDEGRGKSEHREELCAMLARVALRRIDAQAVSSTRSNALSRRTFNRCREYIETHFATLSGLPEVATACGLTVPYLCRLFDQYFDCSPYEYITRLKMTRAENMLLSPQEPIRNIAISVGYKNTRLFARNFKAIFGKNPAEYRAAHA